MPDANKIILALEASDNQPQTAFAALHKLAEEVIGVKLFTITTFNAETGEAQRVFSNMPDAYPVLGTKPADDGPWSQMVLDRHETFVANDIEAISDVFFDYELIQSLGCESAINIPIVTHGAVIGTLNCLHEAGYYTPERVASSEELKLAGAAALLLNRAFTSQG